MGDRLGAIQQHQRADRFGQPDDLRHRVHRAQGVGHVVHRHQLHPRVQQGLQRLQVDVAAVGDRNRHDLGPGGRRHQLPGHDIGVVFQPGDQHPVARLQGAAPPAVRHQVDGGGGAAGPDELFRFRAGEKAGHGVPGLLEGVGRTVAQGVDAAVYVGIVMAVIVTDRLDHARGLLGGGGIVQVHQRMAVDLLVQDGEVAPHPPGIEGRRLLGRPRAHDTLPTNAGSREKRWFSMPCRYSRSGIQRTVSTTSLIKPKLSITCAWVRDTPRLRR